MAELVITAVGTDRAGIASELSGHLLEAGANICDSRMVNLRGYFALIVLVEGSEAVLETARTRLRKDAKTMGLTIELSSSAAAAPKTGVPFRLKSYSMDQPGIVHRITSVLRNEGVNIEDLETHLESAPFMGTPVFTMEILMSVPRELPVKKLRRALETLEEEINCDIDLEPA